MLLITQLSLGLQSFGGWMERTLFNSDIIGDRKWDTRCNPSMRGLNPIKILCRSCCSARIGKCFFHLQRKAGKQIWSNQSFGLKHQIYKTIQKFSNESERRQERDSKFQLGMASKKSQEIHMHLFMHSHTDNKK